jgi:SAM-dependent methyltransferase
MICENTLKNREKRAWWYSEENHSQWVNLPFYEIFKKVMQSLEERIQCYSGSFLNILFLGIFPVEDFPPSFFSYKRSFFKGECIALGTSYTNLHYRLLNSSSLFDQYNLTFIYTLRGCFPIKEHSFDLIISLNDINYSIDPLNYLKKLKDLLRPKGVFLGIFPGENSFQELRTGMAYAEDQLLGGISPRIIPTISLKDAAFLVQQAGFYYPVADIDRYKVIHKSLTDLMKDLRLWNGTNVLRERYKKPLQKAFWQKLQEFYSMYFSVSIGIPTSLEIIYITGQQKA